MEKMEQSANNKIIQQEPIVSPAKIAIAAAALVGTVAATSHAEAIQDAVSQVVSAENTEVEAGRPTPTRERVSDSERERLGEVFSLEQYTYNTLYYRLTNREVMFTDGDGVIIGDPVRLSPIEVRSQNSTVVVTPGVLDERGVPVGNISQQWLNAARVRVGAQYGYPVNLDASQPRVRSTIRLVRDAERFFTQGAERPETFFDIIEHVGARQVPGETEVISYIQYVDRHFGESLSLPVHVEEGLKYIVPGLIAQESQYNDLATSPVGARGMLQIMPETQRTMGFGTQRLSFQRQVELAEKYFGDAYNELVASNAEDFEHITQEFFNGDREAFEKYFLVPVMINSYNAGVLRLSRVISWFRVAHPDRASIQILTKGEANLRYDVFAAMAHLASENNTKETSGYREHSSEYFSRAFALAEVIHNHENGRLLQ